MAKAKAKTVDQIDAKPDNAPGFEWRGRPGGKRVPYWIAARKAVKAGYHPSTVRLDKNAPPEALAAKCQALQADLLAWMGSTDKSQRSDPVRFDGKVGGLIRFYETSPDSPINLPYEPENDDTRGVKFNTRDFYLSLNRALYATVGDLPLRDIKGPDLMRWYNNFLAPSVEGGKRQVARAKNIMGQFVRLVKFGVFAEIDGCARLAVILTGTHNPNGQKGLGTLRFPNARRRNKELTHAQVVAFVTTCRKWQERQDWKLKGNVKSCLSMALATVLQFETMSRQADIIGQWWPVSKSENGVLVRDGFRWRGLSWGTHLNPDTFEFEKPTSKSREKKSIYADLKLSPLAQSLLAEIPREQRIGPVIINEATGIPYHRKSFQDKWRLIARRAGIPDDVQNRDARSGAINEADNAGVQPGQTSKAATHSKIDMTRTYMRENKANAKHVLGARIAARKST
jgi:hypothetical protein